MICQQCGYGPLLLAGKGRIPQFCSSRCRVAAFRAGRKTAIPFELTSRDRWIRHDAEKVPLTIEGRAASSTNSATWTSYKKAKSSTVGVGLGFALGDGIGCIDLDYCIIEGKVTDWAQEILDQVGPTWIEVSPSGRGLHLWGYMQEGPGRRCKGVEVYSVGRYITITGKTFLAAPLAKLPALEIFA